MSYNTIGQLPKKSVSPSEKLEKERRNLGDIKVPEVMIHQKDLDH